MSYKPQRTFNGMPGEPSADTMGPLQISHDIDELCKMFDPNSVHTGGEAGGIGPGNINFSGNDINEIGGVASSDVSALRADENDVLEFSTDGENFVPAFPRSKDNSIYVGFCSTPASTSAKVVSVSDEQNFSLEEGAILIVFFENGNSSDTVTLNVNGTGAKYISFPTGGTSMETVSGNTQYLHRFGREPVIFVFCNTTSLETSLGGLWAHTPSSAFAYYLYAQLALKAPLASPNLTGTPTAPTAASGTNTTQIATTAFVKAAVDASSGGGGTPSSTTPKMDGTAAVGAETAYARGDHVHPTDTSRAPLASPTFTGVPKAPTAASGTNTTQIATTAFVQTAVAGVSGGGTPSSTTPKMDGTAAVGSETAYARGDHIHPTDTSRQAKITASGILKGDGNGGVTAATSGTDYQAPIANNVTGSGTNGYLTKFSGANTVTNGPALGSSTTTFLRNDGSWATPHATATATLAAASWNASNQQSVTVSGVTASNLVEVSPDPASWEIASAAGVYCSAQASNSLTFKCLSIPTAAITVNVVIFS